MYKRIIIQLYKLITGGVRMIGDRIRDLRNQRRISQTDLSKILHVSQQTVTKWETGKAEPSSGAISNLANFFGVSADFLLGTNTKEHNNTADLADKDTIFTYEGRPIPAEDLEYMKRILRGGR